MSFVDRHINPDRLPYTGSGGFEDLIVEEYEIEVERLADGTIEVRDFEPGGHETVEDDFRDNATLFADCPSDPGLYLCDATYTFRYSGRHSADTAVNFRPLEVA